MRREHPKKNQWLDSRDLRIQTQDSDSIRDPLKHSLGQGLGCRWLCMRKCQEKKNREWGKKGSWAKYVVFTWVGSIWDTDQALGKSRIHLRIIYGKFLKQNPSHFNSPLGIICTILPTYSFEKLSGLGSGSSHILELSQGAAAGTVTWKPLECQVQESSERYWSSGRSEGAAGEDLKKAPQETWISLSSV